MDPYVVLKIGSNEQKTSICTNGGKTPKWIDILSYNLHGGETNACIEVMESSRFSSDDFIGGSKLNIDELKGRNKNKYANDISVTYKGEIVGKIYVECNFIPNNSQNNL